MILERLAVRALGCLRDPLELEFDPGINIVTGENEAGKSTLFRALHHAFFTPYGSGAQEIRDLQPWGTELAPEVRVEFRIGEARYRLEKSFLIQPRSRLAIWEDGRFRDLAEADAADERVRSFLFGERPSGAAQERHRGLARLLWIPQGETALPDLEGDLRRQVERSLNAMTLDEAEGRLQALIAKLYFEVWTKNGKGFVKGSGLPALEEEIERLEAAHAGAQAALQAMEQAARSLEETRGQLNALADERKRIEERLAELEGEARRVSALRLQIATKERDLQSCRSRLEKIEEDRRRLRRLRGGVAAFDEELRELVEPRLERLEKDRLALEARRAELRKEMEAADAARHEARQSWRKAKLVHDALSLAREAAAQRERVAAGEALVGRRQEMIEALARMPSPTEADVKEARRLEAELQRLDGQLESLGLKATLTAEADVEGTVGTDGEPAEDFRVGPAEEVEFSALRRIEWRIKGVGVLRVTSGAEEVVALRRKRDETAEALSTHLARFGAASVEALEKARHAREASERELKALEAEIGQHLNGQSLDDARRAQADAERRLAAACATLGIEPGGLEALTPPDLEAEEARHAKAEGVYGEASRSLDELNRSWEALAEQISRTKERKAAVEAGRRSAAAEIERILGEYGSEQEMMASFAEAGEAHKRLAEEIRGLKNGLPPDEDDPVRVHDELKAELRILEEEIQNERDRSVRLQEQLDLAAEKGTYDELARIEERLEQARGEWHRGLRRAHALKLLKTLGDARQARVVEQLTGPISSRVTRYFEQVSGRLGREVQFDQSLKPSTLRIQRQGEVRSSSLSAGAQEQLQVLTRLALARYLAGQSGRLLFVLDDSLVNTDTGRHRRFLELLQEAQEELQIVLLTCHADRYRSLTGARRLVLDTQGGGQG